tara:strand:- start:808 stop:1107 length:300 start_codon:yes stop_codon:yes gene_type:complete
MKKVLLVVILLIIHTINFGQSKYGFVTGTDTLALKYGIKSKDEYRVNVDSLGNIINSVSLGKTNYDSLGYIVSFEDLASTGKIIFTYKMAIWYMRNLIF